ncbi:MAG: DUF4013 domain-containing protein [Methanomicrobiales archaeon]|nr:DUF4013 domain-containing protein [Methanomicrobiales archaeon]
MDIGKALNDSLEYAKDAVWEKWVRWILLIISTIIFPLILGYELEVYRGKKPAPEPTDWGKLFIDGIKLFIIQLIYAIPVLIVALIFIGGGALMAVSGSPGAMIAALGTIAVGFVLTLVVAFVIGLFEAMGVVRFARTGQMGEAFNFNAILAQIGKIGWVSYIVALIVVFVVAFIIAAILSIIPVIGGLLILIVAPALAIFVARYITLLYDSVPA